jgi:hypothetical protein
MTEIDIGQGAVLGFNWTPKNAVRRGWDAHDRNEVGEQDDPKDEKFEGVPSIHEPRVASQGVKFYS